MNLDHVKTLLFSKYSIIDFINLNEFFEPGILYNRVAALKKEEFSNNERIVFVYSENKIKFLLEILSAVDIPIFFTIIIANKEINIGNFNVIKFVGDYADNHVSFDLSNSHCIYPWVNSTILNGGDLVPCCVYQTRSGDNINKTTLLDFYKSDEINKLRSDLRQGNYATGCSSCWQNESAGLESTRLKAKFKLKEIYYQIDYNKNDFQNLQMLDLKLGNNCNLSCRICDSESSSLVAKNNLLHNRLAKNRFIEIKKSANWADTESFWNQLQEITNKLTYLDLYGGEPLLNKIHFTFLQRLIDLGVSHNIRIDYNTNGTVYSEKFFDYWQHFKEVKLSFSIDNIENRFELERSGAKWKTVSANIKKFNNKKSNKFRTDVYPTISILNVYYLPELINWVNSQNFSEPPTLHNMVAGHDYLSINNLPDTVKYIIAKKLRNNNLLDPIINYMMRDGVDLLDKAKSYIKMLDLERSQNFSISHSEFANIIGYQ